MSILEILALLVVAGICGGIGQAITGYSHGGCLVSIALGFIGALIGWWLSRTLGIHDILSIQFGDITFPVIWAIIGATLFVAVIGFLSKRRQ
jgi:uncharacterized membrane protein YeaQ/YmgE (transglycosylase-associated protein family)